MSSINIAIISFPGNNCEVESLRAVKRAGMTPVYFRWNDDRSKLPDIDGYFLPGGFSYEDRGRAGMVAGRDSILDFIRKEAAVGKPVIGNCNGAQVLIESGLVPLSENLSMSLARNVSEGSATGFLNEWIWITPSCGRDRCVTSDWEGAMQMPIAHGEGRFTTKDPDLWNELKEKNQISFQYCTAEGEVSDDPLYTPNGSEYSAAGICNEAGNVVALMPHPERTEAGDPYFASMRKWIENNNKPTERTSHPEHGRRADVHDPVKAKTSSFDLQERHTRTIEIFIDTIIVNNEERTVEQAAKRYVPSLQLKQYRYLAPTEKSAEDILSTISLFNPNKEQAYVRKDGQWYSWNSTSKTLEKGSSLFVGNTYLRRDDPDTGSIGLGHGSETGICYDCANVKGDELRDAQLLEVFCNPHASSLEVLQS